MFIKLIQQYGLETEASAISLSADLAVAKHLAESYGDRAWAVAALAQETGKRWPVFGKRLAVGYPYIEAEIRYACRKEYAETAVDVIARRTRLAFLNAQAALDALPRVIDVMAEEHKWSRERKQQELAEATKFLRYMGLPAPEHLLQYPAKNDSQIADPANFKRPSFHSEEVVTLTVSDYRQAWSTIDANMDGSINETNLPRVLSLLGIEAADDDVRRAIIGLGIPARGTVEYNEFLEVVSFAKESKSRRETVEANDANHDRLYDKLLTERSGGGV
ncbi:MAG: putative glycerol-3-phosphate dehydrogenase, partial [Olpidium bornovanus]